MSNQLVDVVPPHVRFSRGSGAARPTRNLIVKNASVSDLQLVIEPPGPPFCLQLGADRVGKEITLSRGETLPLRLAVDPWPSDRKILCEFLVVRIELCRPVVVDVVIFADGTPEAAIKSLVEKRLAESMLLVPKPMVGYGQPEISEPFQELQEGPVALAAFMGEATAGGQPNEQDAPQSRDPLPTVLPKALADFLGESPAPAALRQPAADQTMKPRSSRVSDSPPDSPESTDGFRHPRDIMDDYGDRPPTPTPDGFEDMGQAPRSIETRKVQETYPAAVPPPPADYGAEPSPAAAATAAAAARAKAVHAKVELEDVEPLVTSARPPPPVGYAPEDIFYIDGVGWCDIYGREITQGKKASSKKPSHAAIGVEPRLAKPSSVKPPKMTAADQKAAWDSIPGI